MEKDARLTKDDFVYHVARQHAVAAVDGGGQALGQRSAGPVKGTASWVQGETNHEKTCLGIDYIPF